MLKRSVVIKAKRINPKFKFKIDYKLLIFFTLMVCGIILGVYVFKNGSPEWHSFFSNCISKYWSITDKKNVLLIFSKFFLPFLLLYLVSYIVALCGMGIPFLSIIPLALGCFFGVEISYYYTNHGLMGIACCGLIYIPVYATATATLIKCCCHCFDISGEIFYYLVSGKGDNKPILREFTLKHLFFVLPIILGAVLSSISFKLFNELFTFI